MRGRALLLWRLVAGQPPSTTGRSRADFSGDRCGHHDPDARPLALHGVTAHPYQTTRALTSGPDVAAMPDSASPLSMTRLDSLEHRSGVIGHIGPFPRELPRS